MQLLNIVLVAGAISQSVEAWSPSNSYVPANVSCASDIQLLREANALSDNETEWLKVRDPNTRESLADFLSRATTNFTDKSLFERLVASNSSNVPKIGIAASGGGYRAMLSGAGMIAAMDNRTVGANEHGLGGILQAATYLAGLSGGNWLTGSLSWNNWTSVQDISDNFTKDDSIWDISNNLVNSGGINIFKTISRWDDISDAVEAKQKAGFNVSLTDIWGRALSYGFFPTLKPHSGEAYTWSTLREVDVFRDGKMPFPITVSDGRYPGTKIINLNATVFEFNPFEMGSWDPTLNAFFDVKYLGTNVTNGTPVVEGQCVEGFDNTGFIMGTSSTLFNQFLLHLNSTKLPSFIRKIAKHYLDDLSEDYDDIAIYSPNPFKGSTFIPSNYSNSLSTSDDLFLVDGGEDNENIPLVPLLQDRRNVDVIFALDNSADTANSWPNGASLANTFERQFGYQGRSVAFPYVPDINSFINLGLNKKPTFFGCDAKNLTDFHYTPPLIVYIPNSEYSFASNQSTFKLSYSVKERNNMIRNGFEAATQGNFTEGSSFMSCVACAIVRRQQERLNATMPEECNACFKEYCWDGSTDNNATSARLKDNGRSLTALNSTVSDESSSSSSTSSSTASSSSKSKSGSGHVAPLYNTKAVLSFITALAFFTYMV